MSIRQSDEFLLMSMTRSTRQRRFLVALFASQAEERPLIPNVRFNLLGLSNANAILDYLFDIAGIRQLGYHLGLPVTASQSRVLQDEAMCILLGRLAFPTHLHNMSRTFGRLRSSICYVFLHVVNLLYNLWDRVLYFNKSLVVKNIDRYCAAVAG
ncbi:hypothetical protein AaE_011259 [Aphanomyces astaci]|uniref:Uncharacterized protein n=1 Tax=Aphanomyces astaci TaxID=112090 RepID=A0A6A5A046_APHAT|nr:hypothetical protein AaE_011259 [Aphanomyces astaci]